MEATIEMSAERYAELIRVIANLKDPCTDAEIKGSVIRQRTNDKNSIFELDLRNIFDENEIDISLTNLKSKFELFKLFQSSQDGVTFDINDDYYKISDDRGFFMKFLNTQASYLDNQFIQEQDLYNIFSATDDDLVFSKELERIVTDRIAVVLQQFNIISLQVILENDKAAITASAQSKDQWATFIQDIETNMVFEKSIANIAKDAFMIDHDSDITFNMYKVPDRDVSMNLFTTNIGPVDVKIYSRAGIYEADE